MSSCEERVNNFSEILTTFFAFFDSLFLTEQYTEDLLKDVEDSLKHKITKNESALPIILAAGGDYDGSIDRAKVDEVKALQELLKARRRLQNATKLNFEKSNKNKEILSLFNL